VLFIDVLSAMLMMLLCIIRCVDVTLIIMYMLWNVYRMLVEPHVVVHYDDSFMFSKKKKKKGRHTATPSYIFFSIF
jgi:uncharacterized membrane protein YqjE